MAVASDSASKKSKSEQKEGKIKNPTKQAENGTPISSSPAERNNNPGVRIIGGRIYDPFNGKTCHQCRQKTRDYVATCKNGGNNKPCPIKFCHKCLLNRYGEKAEDVELLADWNCPKCRGICNCSFCMKKRGCQPTGILAHTAKATGYSSVSEMLQTNGIENLDHMKGLKNMGASPKRINTPNNEKIVSAANTGKENIIEGVMDLNMCPLLLPKNPSDMKSRKGKREDVNEKPDGRCDASLKAISPNTGKKKSKRSKQEESTEVNGSKIDDNLSSRIDSPNKRRSQNSEVNGSFEDNLRGGAKKPKKMTQEALSESKVDGKRVSEKTQDSRRNYKKRVLKEGGAVKDVIIENNDPVPVTSLPEGTGLTAVAGIDLQSEDVGNALQFLEFCAVFGKILGIKKGQPEAVLRDIMHGRSSRRGKCSLTIQFLINMLSFINEEEGESYSSPIRIVGENSWHRDLKICISKSPNVSRSMGLDSLGSGADGYENLNPSKKLRMLNFICDEVLETEKIRDWIDDQNSKFAEKAKEEKEKIVAAKDESKRLKRQMQDEIAEAIIAKNGAPLSILEQEVIVSQIKREAAEAHAAVMESKEIYSKYNRRSEAVRTEPFFLDTDGHAYWKLKCYSDKSVLLSQDIGNGDTAASDEKWFAFDVEQKEIVEKHINSLRVKSVKRRKVLKILPSINSEATPQDLV